MCGSPVVPEAASVHVAIIDDQALLLESVAQYLSGCPGFAPPRTFSTAAAAVAELSRQPADIALVDLHLPGESGIDCLAQLKARRGATLLVAHTVADDEETLARAFAAGAHGYLIKSPRLEDLHQALQQLRIGQPAVSPQALRHIVRSFRKATTAPPEHADLSQAEWRVLSETAAGYDCGAVAGRLDLALATVYVHNRNIFRKLKVNNRLAAVARYHELLAHSRP